MSVERKIATLTGATIGILISFILEVLGAAGAIWGSSEAAELRNEDNDRLWQIIALIIGVVAFFKWTIKQANLYESAPPSESVSAHGFFSRLGYASEKPFCALKTEFCVPPGPNT
jgi:hypothetical protein